jgi:cell division protein FtsL
MATVASVIPSPKAKRRPRNQPVAGRTSLPDTYFVKRIDNSRLRREVDGEKRRECYGLLGLGALVFLFGLFYGFEHFACVRHGYQIEQLKLQRSALEHWNRELRLRQAALTDPQRIDLLARKGLGLAAPTPQQLITIGSSARTPANPVFAQNTPKVESGSLSRQDIAIR